MASSVTSINFHLHKVKSYTIQDWGSYVVFQIDGVENTIYIFGNNETNDDLVAMARAVSATIDTYNGKGNYISNPWSPTATKEKIDEIPF